MSSHEDRAPIRLIQGEEILDWIKEEQNFTFRYQGNIPGFYFLVFVGMVAVGIAIYHAATAGFSSAQSWIIFSILLLAGGYSWLTVFHWALFAARSYVGISEEELMIGRGPKAYLIPTSRLDKDTIDMTDMKRGKYTMVLPVKVDHLKTKVHLVGPFAHLKNLPSFTGEVLTYLLGDEDEEEGAGAAENA